MKLRTINTLLVIAVILVISIGVGLAELATEGEPADNSVNILETEPTLVTLQILYDEVEKLVVDLA